MSEINHQEMAGRMRQELEKAQVERPLRIAVCGKFKSGKTSLLNALLGVDLPVQAITATRFVTRIIYTVGSYLEYQDGTSIVISKEVRDALILNGEREDERLAAVETGSISALLAGGQIEFWDTPGLEDEAELTEITMEALKQCDIVVLVFDANKFGSWYEKHILSELQELFGGNLIFVVNRTDLLNTVEDLEHVKRSAEKLLDGYGNELAGGILYTSAHPERPQIEPLEAAVRRLAENPALRTACRKRAALGRVKRMSEKWIEALDENLARAHTLLAKAEEEQAARQAGEERKSREKRKEDMQRLKEISYRCITKIQGQEYWRNCLDRATREEKWHNVFAGNAKTELRKGIDELKRSFAKETANAFPYLYPSIATLPDIPTGDALDKLSYPVLSLDSGGTQMMAGAAAGAAVGTAVPVIGTLVGGVIGFFAGAARASSNDEKKIAEFKQTCIPDTLGSFRIKVAPELESGWRRFFQKVEGALDQYWDRYSAAPLGPSSRLRAARTAVKILERFRGEADRWRQSVQRQMDAERKEQVWN